jgi:aspartate carbamoyltransferase catalytic subunit
MAAKRLGCDVLNMGAEGSSLKKGESLADTLRAINAMIPDLLVIRCAAEGAAREAADILSCPVVNCGDGTNEHPTQALLDALTLRRRFGRLEGLTVAICGDILHSRVARSNTLLLEKMGVKVKCTGPRELLPDNARCTTDMRACLQDADAVMVLRIQRERLLKSLVIDDAAYFKDYGLTAERLAFAKPGAVVMHPGPMNRGVEIDAAIADDADRSLITTQVEMGVAVRMACLDLLTRSRR